MTEELECPFCNQKFTEQSDLWDHVNALSCEGKSFPSQSDNAWPPPSSNTEILRPERETVSVHQPLSNYESEKVGAQIPNGYHNENARSFEMTPLKISMPSSPAIPPPPPPVTQPKSPATNGVTNGGLFSKKEFPTKPTETALAHSQTPKWKCTLCNIEFAEKQAMMAHVRSAEHEAKISGGATFAGDCSHSIAEQKPTIPVTAVNANNANNYNYSGIKKDELISTIRQVVREELQSMFQSYFNDVNISKHSPLTPSNSMEIKSADTKFINMQGGSLRCEACECSITSVANLSLHFEGKKHKSNVAKLAAQASFY